MLKRRRFWLGVVISVILLYLTFREVEPELIAVAFRDADYRFALVACLFYFGDVLVRALRWQLLLSPIKQVSWRRLYSPLIIGYMANNLLPLRAGELARAYLVGQREQVSKASALATIALERVFDGLAILLWLVVLLPLLPPAPWIIALQLIGAGVFIGLAVITLAVVIWRESALRLIEQLGRRAPTRIQPLWQRATDLLGLFINGLKVVRQGRIFAFGMLLSVLVWLVGAGEYYFMMLAFKVDLPVWVAVATICLVNLVTAIPAAPGNVGTFEATAVATFVAFSIESSLASSLAIAIHLVVFVPVIVVGLLLLWRENLSLADISRRAPVAENTV